MNSPPRSNYLTLVQLNTLRIQVQPLAAVWGPPYLVGSSIERPDFRDVDVRIPLKAKHLQHLLERKGGLKLQEHITSAWLTHAVGLLIDFQFQRLDEFHHLNETRPRQLLISPATVWIAGAAALLEGDPHA